MKTVKFSVFLALVLMLFAVISGGCASKTSLGALRKDPTMAKYIKEFFDPYELIIPRSFVKEFIEKCKTDEERKACIDKFWQERDENPLTPQNEFKIRIDSRINFIKQERFFRDPDILGFRFVNNGGLKGDPAKVFILMGMPALKDQLLNDDYIKDLMVWYYLDQEGVVYRFLFYKDFDGAPFELFIDQSNYMELKLVEISRRIINTGDYDSLEILWNHLMMVDSERVFLAALYEFSSSGESIDKVLKPPLPAAELVKLSGARILGRPPKINNSDFVLSRDKTLIKGYFRIVNIESSSGTNTTDAKSEIYSEIRVRLADLDWKIEKDDKVRTTLKVKLTFYNKKNPAESCIFEAYVDHPIDKNRLDGPNKNEFLSIKLAAGSGVATGKNDRQKIKRLVVLDDLPPGEYRVTAELSHTITHKYGAWVSDLTRK